MNEEPITHYGAYWVTCAPGKPINWRMIADFIDLMLIDIEEMHGDLDTAVWQSRPFDTNGRFMWLVYFNERT